MPQHFYRITCILQTGPPRIGIVTNPTADVDMAYLIYLRQAQDRFKGQLEDFDCVKVSTHHKDVKKHLKGTITNVKINDHDPDEEWWLNTPESDPNRPRYKSRKELMAEAANQRAEEKRRRDKDANS